MKANELRIGNYVYDSIEDVGVIQVKEIKEMNPNRVGNMSISYLGVKGGYCTTSLQENEENLEPEDYLIQPIPLTEEWLLKFGFEKEGEQYNLQGISIEDIHNGEKWCVYMFDEYNAVECALSLIKHVHTLQNLYFALTGEELTIKNEER